MTRLQSQVHSHQSKKSIESKDKDHSRNRKTAVFEKRRQSQAGGGGPKRLAELMPSTITRFSILDTRYSTFDILLSTRHKEGKNKIIWEDKERS
jgi:hypothetical protein